MDPFDEYALWCELHQCRTCEGTGEVIDDHDNERTCPECDGTGIATDAVYEGPAPI